MTINWEFWDVIDDFDYFTAACLWLDIEPEPDERQKPRSEVKALIDLFKTKQEQSGYEKFERLQQSDHEMANLFRSKPSTKDIQDHVEKIANQLKSSNRRVKRNSIQKTNDISRWELREIAKSLELRPRLLFKDATRVESQILDDIDPTDKILDTRSNNSWRRLVKILAIASKNYPMDSSTVGNLIEIAQLNGIKLCKDTIRACLKEAFAIDPSSEPDD